MADLVLDASATLAWLIRRTNTAEDALANQFLEDIRNGAAIVPALWFPEVANGILVAERRGVVAPILSKQFRARLATLAIQPDPTPPETLIDALIQLARAYKLTAYDATYLELALRCRLPLATFDKQLAAAARLAGVQVAGD